MRNGTSLSRGHSTDPNVLDDPFGPYADAKKQVGPDAQLTQRIRETMAEGFEADGRHADAARRRVDMGASMAAPKPPDEHAIARCLDATSRNFERADDPFAAADAGRRFLVLE